MVAPRRIGAHALFPVAFGAMNLSLGPDARATERALRAALDAGVQLIDTADVYGRGPEDAHGNERLVGRALRGTSDVRVTTKVGVVREGERWLHRGHPDHLRSSLEASVRALGREPDYVLLHAVPDDVPLAEALGVLATLRDAGRFGALGISNVDVSTLAAAADFDLVVVQNEMSPYVSPDPAMLAATAELGVALQGYAPMGGWRAGRTAHEAALQDAGARAGLSPFEVIVPWLLGQAPHVSLVCGGTDPAKIASSARAAERTLPEPVRQALDAAYLG